MTDTTPKDRYTCGYCGNKIIPTDFNIVDFERGVFLCVDCNFYLSGPDAVPILQDSTLLVKEILLGAAGLIDSGWTQHAAARDKDGNNVNPMSTDAVCWCISGAIECVVNEYKAPHFYSVAKLQFVLANDAKDVIQHNDYRIKTKQQAKEALITAAKWERVF